MKLIYRKLKNRRKRYKNLENLTMALTEMKEARLRFLEGEEEAYPSLREPDCGLKRPRKAKFAPKRRLPPDDWNLAAAKERIEELFKRYEIVGRL
jgi:hypothetical protein